MLDDQNPNLHIKRTFEGTHTNIFFRSKLLAVPNLGPLHKNKVAGRKLGPPSK